MPNKIKINGSAMLEQRQNFAKSIVVKKISAKRKYLNVCE
jgi:hypothetical protein